MKHTVEVKFPKLFKRRVKDPENAYLEESNLTTEITIDVDGLKATAKKYALPVTLCAGGLTVGYLAGFKSGVVKVIGKEVVVVSQEKHTL